MAKQNGNLNARIDEIAQRVMRAEKLAEKKIKSVLKSTESMRTDQLKNLQKVLKNARSLRSSPLAKRADQVRKDIEAGAAAGFHMLLKRLDLPTRSEVQKLQKKVANLQKTLDSMKKSGRA